MKVSLFGIGIIVFGMAVSASAQTTPNIELPNTKHLFDEDTSQAKKAKKKKVKTALAQDKPTSGELDVQAPRIEYEKDQTQAVASGGVSITTGTLRIQSDSAVINSNTKDSDLQGRVVLSSPEARVVAESGKVNLDTEAGKFNCSSLVIEESNYRSTAGEIRKLNDKQYEMDDVTMTTCTCPEGTTPKSEGGTTGCVKKGETAPWNIHASTVHVSRDGYVNAYNAWVDFHGVPVVYSPYIGFPIKEKRQSGLLVPSFGYSDQGGFAAKVPLYLTLGESADVTLTPFTEVKSRTGTSFDYRQDYSRYNQLRSRFYYSDESARDGNLQGTDTTGLYDPTFDNNRYGGYLNHIWRSEPDAAVPISYVMDGHYVSDELFLREMNDDQIGEATQSAAVSRALVTAGLGEYGSAELLGEYIQSIDSENPDQVVQRLPELSVGLTKTVRPWGYNQYGAKLVTRFDYTGDDFYRKDGYDGLRNNLAPSVTLPFHVSNYTQGSLGVSYMYTKYNLNKTDVPNSTTDEQLESSQDRNIPIYTAGLGTAVERVFEVDKDNWLGSLTRMGQDNQDQLVRLKHTIEPSVRFIGIPNVDQDSLPQFDALDRITEKRQLLYGFRSSLYGRFMPTNRTGETVTEAVPEASQLQPLGTDINEQPGFGQTFDTARLGGFAPIKNGDTRELLTLIVRQNFDILEDKDNEDPDRNGFSDVAGNVYLFPTPNFALGFESNIDTQHGKFDSWAVSNNFFSDRGDALRARYTFTRNSDTGDTAESQVQAGAEVKLIERLKLGLYSRYDALNGSNLNSLAALRFYGACDCWHIDFGVGEQANPDKKEVTLSFTFHGLGDIAQSTRLNSGNSQ